MQANVQPASSSARGGGRHNARKRFRRGRGQGSSKSTAYFSSMDSHSKPTPAQESPSKPTNDEVKPQVSNTKHLSKVRFDSLKWISPPTMRSLIGDLGFINLTEVQEATLSVAHEGVDLLAKAKTGTGKTMGFLLPTVERIVQLKKRRNLPRFAISALILSPTRELANQIAKEAEVLTKHHDNISVVCFVGGTKQSRDVKRLNDRLSIDILICTPGRLEDHLGLTGKREPYHDLPTSVGARVSGLRVLVLDEADQLLEMGFRPSIERIVRRLPRSDKRQTLLFSATMPEGLNEMIKKSELGFKHRFIDTIKPEDEETNAQVDQSVVVCPFDKHIEILAQVLDNHIFTRKEASERFKVMVFFPTARIAGYMASLFKRMHQPVLEMHSRKSQAQRTKMAEQFRFHQDQVMFSSDVSARGVDYPDVSLIIQIGLTEKKQYIHRLGRTARAGRSGAGVLILSEFERFFVDDLKGLPLKQLQVSDMPSTPYVTNTLKRALSTVPIDGPSIKAAEQAYQAWLGFYKGYMRKLRWTPVILVQTCNRYALLLGLKEPPTLAKRLVGKMRLQGVPGLRVSDKAVHKNIFEERREEQAVRDEESYKKYHKFKNDKVSDPDSAQTYYLGGGRGSNNYGDYNTDDDSPVTDFSGGMLGRGGGRYGGPDQRWR